MREKINAVIITTAFLVSGLCSVSVASDLSDVERDARALELYLQDKKDFKKHCPGLKWDQPKIETYKKELKSQLPAGCKK